MPKVTLEAALITYVFKCSQCETLFWVDIDNYHNQVSPCTCPHCECFVELPNNEELENELSELFDYEGS